MSRISIDNVTMGNGLIPPIAVIYGTPGIGKTTLAASLPKPIFIQTEEGLTSPILQGIPTFGLLASYEDVKEAFGEVAKHAAALGIKTVVLDSLDGMDPMLEQYVARQNGYKKGCFDVEYGRGVPPLLDEWRFFMRMCAEIRRACGVNVILIGRHAKIKVTPPDSEAYSRYSLTLNEKIARIVIGESDMTLFLNRPVNVISKDAGFGKTNTRGISDQPRIYCLETAAHEAKNRYSMPAYIGLSIEHLAQYVPSFRGGINPLTAQAVEVSAA